MPAPGLTRWVTSAAHLLAFVREATWSRSIFLSWLESLSLQDCKLFVCPHLYPFQGLQEYPAVFMVTKFQDLTKEFLREMYGLDTL